jgi:putative ABC transport system permease protein
LEGSGLHRRGDDSARTGIGTNTAIFSLVNVLLFEPPPYNQPAEVVQLFSQDKTNPKSFRGFSYPTFCYVRDQNSVFSGVLAHYDTVVGVGEQGKTRRASADLVSANYFSVLGVMPTYGRSFLPEEEKPGRNERVAIISFQLLAETVVRSLASRSFSVD